jgi:diguanylate cyclase (GGDEF)-like protein
MTTLPLTRILMVEDEPDILAVARLALESLGGFEVRMCSSGFEAVQAVPAFSPDLILLDVMMPDMDGPSTLRALRALPRVATTPVIFMTAKVQPQEIARYRAMGVLDVIAKPFDPMTLSASIRAIWERYQPVEAGIQARSVTFAELLPARLAEIDAAWESPSRSPGSHDLAVLQRLAHSLHGAGATFGLAELSRAARELEQYLASLGQPVALTSEQRTRIGQLIAALKAAALAPPLPPLDGKRTSTSVPHSAGGEAENRMIVLAELDPALESDLAAQLGHFGYATQTCAALGEPTATAAPAAIITTVDTLDALHAGQRLAAGGNVAWIVVSDHGDLETRLRAARAGAVAFYTRPVNIVALIDKLDVLTSRYADEPYRILIVDDEPELGDYYAAALQQAGMVVVVVTDPMSVLAPLAELRPDLILMDMYMPGCDGLDLAAVIRQQEDYVSTPIVFLSAETSMDMQLEAMRLGGDDFMTKPIARDHLISAVSSRVQRSRELRAFMVRDGLTGLLNHTTTKEQLEIELARAARHQAPLAYAIIDLDHFKLVNDTYGHPTGDRVLKSLARLLRERLRKTDIIGRYGGEEFAVVLVGTDGPTAVAVIDEIRAGLSRIRQQAGDQEFTVTFSCGIACSMDYADAPKLTDAADKALYAAKRGGRNRVVLAGKSSET